jgi:hypothetical protein
LLIATPVAAWAKQEPVNAVGLVRHQSGVDPLDGVPGQQHIPLEWIGVGLTLIMIGSALRWVLSRHRRSRL